eukprot:TRINITY_DN4654_c0_g1_i6.p2 TRINITY_DN4654_c0_g1~~TRINITY_DN4654_c0_g1_i6.p2  ORF type:complete len:270 (+),score=79.07 TRINITY_DN4654_c0_g1_i6:736-1545(+)
MILVAIDFIKQNLKIHLASKNEMNLSYAKGEVHLQDIFNNRWLNITNNSNQPETLDPNELHIREKIKRFIENYEVVLEKEYLSLLNMFYIGFSVELFEMIIKRYYRVALRIMGYEMMLRSLKITDVEVQPMFEDLTENERVAECNKDMLLLFSAFLFDDRIEQALNNIRHVRKLKPTMKIYVLNVFSEKACLEALAELKDCEVVNVISIQNAQDFKATLEENCLRQNIDLWNEFYNKDKVTKMIYQTLQKRILKYQEEVQLQLNTNKAH